ncbi:MAG: lipoyl synthase, partial [Spirochaetes bacterium]|nr:lipoyl synthase [Spirochaetota bacterium]
KKPEWLKKQLFLHSKENFVKNVINKNNIHTVCSEARCPNIGECFSRKTAAFLLLGRKCTRNCRFCNISTNNDDLVVDKDEPSRISSAVKKLKLKYVVLTSVTRDDLDDGGAFVFIETIRRIKKIDKNILVEVLVPDFLGNFKIIEKILNEDICVFNHNLETVKRLYPEIRPMADYNRSLDVLKFSKEFKKKLLIKTGIMAGLGEHYDEVIELIDDIKKINIDALTIGQYLQPGKYFYPVKEYVTREKFKNYKDYSEKIGIKNVFSDVFVRSSYFSENFYINSKFKI